MSKLPQGGNLLNGVTEHNEQTEFASSLLTSDAKIRLFRTLFAVRTDPYARRWESREGKKKSDAPVCANEGREGICEKPTVHCHECSHRAFEPVTDAVVREHLTGAQVVELYTLDTTSRCLRLNPLACT